MHPNIRNLVYGQELSQARVKVPLYKAISGSIDALEERQGGFSNHVIRICLIVVGNLAHRERGRLLGVNSFDVIDDGVSFNDKNLALFEI